MLQLSQMQNYRHKCLKVQETVLMGEGKKGSLLPSPVVLWIVYMRERKHKNKCKTKNMTFHQAAANVA